jgi:hypothetical protein
MFLTARPGGGLSHELFARSVLRCTFTSYSCLLLCRAFLFVEMLSSYYRLALSLLAQSQLFIMYFLDRKKKKLLYERNSNHWDRVEMSINIRNG